MKNYLKVVAEAYWYMELLYLAVLILHLTVKTDAFVLSWYMLISPIPLAVIVAYLHLKFGMFKEVFGEEYLKSVDKRQK